MNLIMTKYPKRYIQLFKDGIIPKENQNFWFGISITNPRDEFFWSNLQQTFVNIQPILRPFVGLTDGVQMPTQKTDWIILGAKTGRRKYKVIPEKGWLTEIVKNAKDTGVPIFMQDSLRSIMGEDFIQEFPWRKTVSD